MKNLFRKMYEIWSEKRTGYQFAATSVFYTILEQLKKEMSHDKSKPTFSKMSEIVEYINTNYQDSSLTVSQLAEIYGTSETFFRREFTLFSSDSSSDERADDSVLSSFPEVKTTSNVREMIITIIMLTIMITFLLVFDDDSYCSCSKSSSY